MGLDSQRLQLLLQLRGIAIDDAVVEGVLMGLIGAVGDPPCTDGSAGCPWIGMTNLSGTWEWVDGTPATYLNFAPGEPTGDCNYVQFNRYGTTGWNDSPDDALFGYICER